MTADDAKRAKQSRLLFRCDVLEQHITDFFINIICPDNFGNGCAGELVSWEPG